MYSWRISPEESHQCIWLQGVWRRYGTFNALQVVVMDQHHIAGRGVLCDSVTAEYARAIIQLSNRYTHLGNILRQSVKGIRILQVINQRLNNDDGSYSRRHQQGHQ
jgi:hypothetical protein